MAQVANTYETYDAVGNREALSNIIHRLKVEDTPFLSMLKHEKVDGVHPEWQTDTLANPTLANNFPEGDEYNYTAAAPTARVGNYCQISRKDIIVSGTQEVVSKAGRESEVKLQKLKRGLEMKTDMEVILLSNQASSAGSGDGVTNRTSGGFRAWVATNDLLGAGGASGGFNSGTGLVGAATNGTQRAFTKTLLDSALLTAYNNGGNPTDLFLSPYLKTVFSTFMNDANVAPQYYATPKAGGTTIVASADIYHSDFGEITVKIDRQLTRLGATAARNAYLIDPSMVALGELRPIMPDVPGKTGDAHKEVILTEYTLVMKNEKAHAVIADLFGMTSAS